ncbi:anti-sigma factor [Aliiroseovarius sp. Z3]|uniref:anti-sigma factor n=1 Tax=Aliiroseovarius sp. Z3 TaxID=2811402 RepID=UPI0023B3511A|nr:anti-sigma factor [Aliiroseovarius sp. Z3]MDE9451982.1 anti-sigma factor [Aliiroseovarius sp. Z3]
MSTADTYDRDDDVLAAEYALHLLSAEDRRAFETRMQEDARLRDLVRDWDHQFHALSDEFDSVAPPAHVKAAIQARVFGSAQKTSPLSGVVGWLLGGSVAAVLALALVAILPLITDPQTSAPTHTAEISAQDQSLIVTAAFSANSGEFTVRRVAGGPASGRDLEMWLIPQGADAPISLGVMPDEDDARITLPDELRARLTAATFAISDEPKGGSPTGQPTGAVLAAGPVQVL